MEFCLLFAFELVMSQSWHHSIPNAVSMFSYWGQSHTLISTRSSDLCKCLYRQMSLVRNVNVMSSTSTQKFMTPSSGKDRGKCEVVAKNLQSLLTWDNPYDLSGVGTISDLVPRVVGKSPVVESFFKCWKLICDVHLCFDLIEIQNL